jgi:hypothetical protein
VDKTHDTPINCRGTRRDQSGRPLAICEIGTVNLKAWLVSEGWALAYRSPSLAFVPAEDTAREAAKGICGSIRAAVNLAKETPTRTRALMDGHASGARRHSQHRALASRTTSWRPLRRSFA